ncbi:EAL domain-containing protein [Croceibacterium mercuriale]|uniref:EAL domain-containing protein n=1 Tax=Croceibacterium mercuriale TaxID=1572751 RepID=UPI00069258E0|nr:EAL domain-containing protein [Croceibacterium mercuriale]
MTSRLHAPIKHDADRRVRFFAVVEFERFIPARQTVGFEIANRILVRAADRILAAMQGGSVGRIGHDSIEFSFRAADVAAARHDLSRCLALLERRLEIAGVAFQLTGTVAFAPIPAEQSAVTDEMFDAVLAALAGDGEGGAAAGGRIRQIDPGLPSSVQLDDLALLRALPRALAANELHLVYQPKLDCRTGAHLSAEALLRWDSPTLGPVSTIRMITLAERTGAIRDITNWVIRQVLRDQAVLRGAGHELCLFVNMSGPLLCDQSFMAEVMGMIASAGSGLGIEITETSVIEDPEAAIETLAALAAANVPVAIDDFGSGLSSLAYLKRLPVSELKIDRMFVSHLTSSNRDPLIVRASIDLAHAMDMTVTAEGVEDAMCQSLLQVMGCDALQGYHIARPMPLPNLLAFLRDAPGHAPPVQTGAMPVRLVHAANPGRAW